jgi:hypothetical protein
MLYSIIDIGKQLDRDFDVLMKYNKNCEVSK